MEGGTRLEVLPSFFFATWRNVTNEVDSNFKNIVGMTPTEYIASTKE